MKIRTIIGRFFGYGGCSICHNTWNWKKEQSIPYSKKITAKNSTDLVSCMFPLCKECFDKVPEEKIVRYSELLMEHWIAESGSMDIIKNFDRYMDNIRHNVTELKR